jgi:hypothetical protein
LGAHKRTSSRDEQERFISMPRMTIRRLTAGLGAAGLAAGLALTAAGTAQAAVPD